MGFYGNIYNSAFAKLQNQINELDYSESSTTKIITKVTQTDGKISVERGDAGTLVLTGYDVGTNGEKIASTDSINTAFAKLQTQIVHLTANANGERSIVNQIQTAIQGLDSEKVATAGKYISGIHIEDGKIASIDETTLPEISWSDVTNKPTNLVTSDQIVNMVEDADIEGMITESNNFTYPAIKDSTGAEINPANTAMTIALLFEKVAALEARIYALEHPDTNETPEPTPTE